MITLDNIGFEFSGRWLYRSSTLQIKPGDRIGLVGRNGTGKTTLIRLITGELRAAEGQISMAKSVKIGWLNQEMQSLESDQTVLQVALEAFEDVMAARKDIERILNDPALNHDERLIQQLTEKQAFIEAVDGYQIETKAATILAGLGFSEHDQNQPFNNFSGGWRMRVMLAQLLLMEPDLLLLDEPTNHLDLPSIEWMEDYLKNFPGAFVIISHDRHFLDRLITTTVEIDRQRIVRYKGNYTFFLQEKEERAAQHQREYENQQKMIAETERFINRFRAKATKAKQVQSKIKLLDKIERIAPPEAEAATVNFQFAPNTTPGKNILYFDAHEKRYGPKLIIKESKATIMRGDKIALVGANGIGKSTVLRMVASMEPFDGDSRLGHNVEPGFFAQHQLDALTHANDILEEMSDYVYQLGESQVRSILGGFLFTGDDVFKRIGVLSGGEKSRVALAKTLLAGANFLLLDEPTNHLDIQSIEILCDALIAYEGTFIAVSHDRYFLRRVANKIWYIEDQQLKEYPGTYGEFEAHMAQRKAAANGQTAPSKKKTAQSPSKEPAKKPVSDYHAEKARRKKERQVKNQYQKVEGQIMELEEEREKLLQKMADPEMASKFEELEKLQQEVNRIDGELGPAQEKWEELLIELEEMGIEV